MWHGKEVRWLLLFCAVLGGCAAPGRFAVTRPELTCERATRVAYRTMVQLGYAVTDVVPPHPERLGTVTGERTLPDGSISTKRVTITCGSAGATLQPYEDEWFPTYEFSRIFGYSFKSLLQRPDVETPTREVGLQLLVHAVVTHEALLDLGGVPTNDNALLVRVTIRNHTDRAVHVDPKRVLLKGTGALVPPLSGAALAAAIAPGEAGDRVRAEPLRAERIDPHSTRSGYLVYPAGSYREAEVAIEDVETQESDGLVVPIE